MRSRLIRQYHLREEYGRFGLPAFVQAACDAWDRLIAGGASEEDLSAIRTLCYLRMKSDRPFHAFLIELDYLWQIQGGKMKCLTLPPPSHQ